MDTNAQKKVPGDNKGRNHGWIVESDGKPIAVLSNYRRESYFWDRYTISPIPGCDLPDAVFQLNFWTSATRFRNIATGKVVTGVLVSADGFPSREDPSIVVRYLYHRNQANILEKMRSVLLSWI